MTDDLKDNNRYYFLRNQLVALGIGFAITSVVVFVLGIITGRHIERRHLAEHAASEARIPVAPPTTKLEFALKAQTSEAPPAAAGVTQNRALPPSDKEPAREPKAHPQIVKAENATATAPVKEAVKSAPQLPAAKSAEQTPPAPVAQEKRQISQPVKGKSSAPVWTVQVKSSPDKKFADIWADRLKTKGYDAFVVAADIKGQTWYRVRVGHLTARQEAEALRTTLESQEKLSGAFLTIVKPGETAAKGN
jgi:DedD protein